MRVGKMPRGAVARAMLGALALVCGLLLSPRASAEDKEIEAEGRAKIFAGNATRAKEEATANALKEVIRLASAATLGDELYKKNEKEVAKRVLATPKRYTNWFGVASESYTTTEAIVKVKASVSIDKLKVDLASFLAPATPTVAAAGPKKALLLAAPIPPEEFFKEPSQRKTAPEVPGLMAAVETLLQDAGYEVSSGGAIGPADNTSAVGARAKAASAQLAVIASAVGGASGQVSIVNQRCAQVTVRLFLVGADGTDSGTFKAAAQGCDASPEGALRVAGLEASTRVSSAARADGRLRATKRRLKVTQIPSFAVLESTTKTLKDLAGPSTELLGVDSGAAVYSYPAGAADPAGKLAALLGAKPFTEDGVSTVAVPRARVLAEGVTNEALLSALCDVIGKLPGVTGVSAPALPELNGTAEIWVWGLTDLGALSSAVRAQTLYGRALTPTVQTDALRVVVAPSSLEKPK